jgi:hypothetical protein
MEQIQQDMNLYWRCHFVYLMKGKKARTASGTYIVGLFDISES